MTTTLITYTDRQVRTLDQIYRFQIQPLQEGSSLSLVIKIYDKQRALTSSQNCSLSIEDWHEVFSEERGEMLLKKAAHKGWIPDPVTPPAAGGLKKIISLAKTRIPAEGLDLAQFVCPLSMEVFVDPVLDNCGHTFERHWIERSLERTDCCPLSRQRIHSLTPIHHLREVIAEWSQRDPIPAFSLVKKTNAVLALKHLETAQLHRGRIDDEPDAFEDALKSYTEAFKYTHDWREYAALPPLFLEQQQLEKGQLAYLYLAEYQMEAGVPEKAIESLEAYRALSPTLSVNAPLAELYQSLGKTKEAVDLLLLATPISAAFYIQALHYDPYRWEVYEKLASLGESPLEKSHLFLKGACHALEKQDKDQALAFARLAASGNGSFFVDHLIDLQLSQPPYAEDPEALKKKLLSLAHEYETTACIGDMVKAYKRLCYLDYHPTYYRKLIDGYNTLGKRDQALSWTIRWIPLLIERQEWDQAEQLSLQTLQEGGPSITLWKHLETLYTHWNTHKLCDLWGQLGAAHEKNQQLETAESVYQKAFDMFHRIDHALSLAQLQHARGATHRSVRTYYEASSLSLVEDNRAALALSLRSIRQIDPQLQHLDPMQKIHLVMQERLCQLQEELVVEKKRVFQLEKELVAVKKSVVDLKELNHRTSPVPSSAVSSSTIPTAL